MRKIAPIVPTVIRTITFWFEVEVGHIVLLSTTGTQASLLAYTKIQNIWTTATGLPDLAEIHVLRNLTLASKDACVPVSQTLSRLRCASIFSRTPTARAKARRP